MKRMYENMDRHVQIHDIDDTAGAFKCAFYLILAIFAHILGVF